MRLSSIQLQAFREVCRTRHFGKAAKNLGLTQSALSQRVLKLEDELESTLLIRERSDIRLTESGQKLQSYCQMMGQLEEDFFNEIEDEQQGLTGSVRIAGFSSCMRSFILPKLAPLLRENPGLDFHFLTRELEDLPKLLQTGEVDFVILDHYLENKNIESQLIGEEENVLIESSSHQTPEIYLDHDERDETTFNFLKANRLSSKNIQRRYLDDIYGLIDGVEAGLGKAVVAKHLVEGRKGIKTIRTKRTLRAPYILHYSNQAYYSQVHSAIKNFL